MAQPLAAVAARTAYTKETMPHVFVNEHTKVIVQGRVSIIQQKTKELEEESIRIEDEDSSSACIKKTYADIRSSEELLGYKPSINLEDGIKLFTDWYKEYYNNQISTSIWLLLTISNIE